jgi:DNA-binding response OmpR family regulator
MADLVNTLVVDDDSGVRFFLEETLRQDGHVVATASSGEEALDLLRDAFFDVVMLDLKLGGRTDGLRVLEAVRWRWPETVVVILTAHGSLKTAMAAIQEGVDGYLLKPAEPDEVRQAVQEALERRRSLVQLEETREAGHILQRGPFTIDLKKHLVTFEEEPLELTSREFKLLAHLMRNANQVVSPRKLVEVVGQYEVEDLYEARQIVKWYIHRLRRKVEPEPSEPRYILNVRGVGYRFVE